MADFRFIKHLLFASVILSMFLSGCDKGDEVGNELPDTRIGLEAINLTGDNRLNSTVRLSWYGTDKDGYIEGFELSFDNLTWEFVTNQDSTFSFPIGAGNDSVDIDFYVRSVDDDGGIDPTPAFLSIPLKNTPPVATLDPDALPQTVAPIVMTFRWSFDDLDGDETVESAFIRINDGNWYELDKNSTLFSITPVDPTATGASEALVYLDVNETPNTDRINGLVIDDSNRVYIKVVDIAGSESLLDTSNTIFLRGQKSDLLLVNGEPSTQRQVYEDALNLVYPSYDLVNYETDGGSQQPKFWNPTFRILTQQYDKLIFNSDQSLFSNSLTGQSSLLLEFAAPHLQSFIDKGGKSLISSTFPDDVDLTPISGIMPIDSFSSATGQAFLTPDSTIVPELTGYPELTPQSIIFGLDPFYLSIDADPFYTANYTANGGWTGPREVAAFRKRNDNINQIFFSVGLHQFNTDPNALNDLFDKILNDDFNW